MKNVRLLGISIAVVGVLLCSSAIGAPTVVGFDDVTTEFVANPPAGYNGLNWTNFGVVRAADLNPSGYLNGMISREYVAFNHNGNPASFSAVEGPVKFVGAYFTAAWQDGLLIEVDGFVGGQLVYSTEFVVDTGSAVASAPISPLWVEFNWCVDEVHFASSGGTPAFDNRPSGGTQFAMDNLTLDTCAVPAPGAVLLGSLGMGLVGWMRRRKTL